MRSGGNWFTWPFKVIDLKEIQFLKEERDAKREGYAYRDELRQLNGDSTHNLWS